MSRMRRVWIVLLLSVGWVQTWGTGQAQGGEGWVEPRAAGVRPRLSEEQIRDFVPPSRGAFRFPAPYNTEAIRITDASDCPGQTDCVFSIGYSYWRNTNNHVDSDEMLLFLGLDRRKGGPGPTLFRYDKNKGTIVKAGPLFEPTSKFSWNNAAGWYFSASMSHKLYLNDGPNLLRYDVVTHQLETVFDASSLWGNDKAIGHMHSSNNDLVHSATLTIRDTNEALGCLVYHEEFHRFAFFGKVGGFDQCAVDKSGHWLMSLENIDGLYDLDMRIFDLAGEKEIARMFDEEGAVGDQADFGFGYIVGDDNSSPLPNATATWLLGQTVTKGPVVHTNINWNLDTMHHRSHTNAKPGVPMEDQFACGSTTDILAGVESEITCVRLDGSNRQLIVAPAMSRLETAGGETAYNKYPKGNLDITGQYFVWTTNMAGDRLDAVLVKVPSNLLYK